MKTFQTKRAAACAAGAALFALSAVAFGGSISGVKVEPRSAQTGQQVKVTVDGEDESICGLRVEYGNGDVDVTKMSESRDRFPRSFMKSYSQPGTYTIIAKGGRDGSTFGCPGESKTTVTIIEAPKPVVVAQEPVQAPARTAAPAYEPPRAASPPLKDDPKTKGRGAKGG